MIGEDTARSELKRETTQGAFKGQITIVSWPKAETTSNVAMVERPTEITSNIESYSDATTGKELTVFKELMLTMNADYSASGSLTDLRDNWKPVSAEQSFPVCHYLDDYPSWHPVWNKMMIEFYDSLQDSKISKLKESRFV